MFAGIKHAGNELENIIQGLLTKNRPDLFVSDLETINTIIKSFPKKYKMTYRFLVKCHSSIELFPKLVDYVNTVDDIE